MKDTNIIVNKDGFKGDLELLIKKYLGDSPHHLIISWCSQGNDGELLGTWLSSGNLGKVKFVEFKSVSVGIKNSAEMLLYNFKLDSKPIPKEQQRNNEYL